MRSERRRRILLVVLVVVAIAYGATWLLGVRAVKAAHKQDLLHFYKKQEAFYGENRAELEKNVFWKDMLENYGGFPTWEEYQDWHAREQDDRYYAVIPFIILAWREGEHTGVNEYHVWYVLGSAKIHQRLRWIE